MALTLSFFYYVKILVFFDESLWIYVSEYALLEYISLFACYRFTKNRVRTKKALEKKDEIFLFIFFLIFYLKLLKILKKIDSDRYILKKKFSK